MDHLRGTTITDNPLLMARLPSLSSYESTYARTASNSVGTTAENTENDAAIAQALAEGPLRDDSSCNAPVGTLADEELARKLQQQEDEGLVQRRKHASGQRAVSPKVAPLLQSPWHHNALRALSQATMGLVERVPLIPRVNSMVPPASRANADRDRVALRLDMYGLVERPVKGDGACQFRALSDQMYGSQEHHGAVRSRVVRQLRERQDRYRSYVPMEYEVYVDKMALPETWGDHVTLQAAADAYGMGICIISSFLTVAVISIDPQQLLVPDMVLWLAFWAEVHYASVGPRGRCSADSNLNKLARSLCGQ